MKVVKPISSIVRDEQLGITKYLDPIYCKRNQFIILDEAVDELSQTPEFLRLWEIKQLGYTALRFPSCSYETRAEHSLGTSMAFKEIILPKIKNKLRKFRIFPSRRLELATTISLLLHDLGHCTQSHGFEKVTEVPHELMTKIIISRKDGNIRKIIEKYLGSNGPELVNYLIKLEECDYSELKSRYELTDDDTKVINLFRQLTSHSIDADRLDYLARDYFYVFGKKQNDYDVKNLFKHMELRIDTNGEIRMLFDYEGNYMVSKILFFRIWMYENVYDCPESDLGDYMMTEFFKAISKLGIKKYKNLDIDKFLQLVDKKLEDIYLKYIHMDYTNIGNLLDPDEKERCIRYAVFFANVINNFKTFKYVEGNIEEKMRRALIAILPDKYSKIIEDTKAIFSTNTKKYLYKNEEKIEGYSAKGLLDLSEISSSLKHDIHLIVQRTYISNELLLIDLDIEDTDERNKISKAIDEIVETLMKPEMEFELKLDIPKNLDARQTGKQLLDVLQKEGFKIVSTTQKHNGDVYHDTDNFDLLKSGATLRYRKLDNDKADKDVEWTYKTPQSKANLFALRSETVEYAKPYELNLACKLLKDKAVVSNEYKKMLENITMCPVAEINTKRQITVISYKGVELEFAVDESYATNLLTKKTKGYSMIEIELKKGMISDTAVLKYISDIVAKEFDNLKPMKNNKYALCMKDEIE